jgi:hypothetical protein
MMRAIRRLSLVMPCDCLTTANLSGSIDARIAGKRSRSLRRSGGFGEG